MKHILCYGDSNTFGSMTECDGRYDYQDRWTTILSSSLGDGYRIIDEGLGGRTTVFDDPFVEGKNGYKYLGISLESHKPLDLVIIMLGTNDTKQIYNASAKSIAYGVSKLVEKIKSANGIGNPEVLIVSPPYIEKGVGSSRFESFDESAPIKSRELAFYFKKTAEATGSYFFDAATVAHVGSDCLHMTKDSHRALGEALSSVVREII